MGSRPRLARALRHYGALGALTGLAAYLRFSHLDLANFGLDQATVFVMAANMLDRRILPLVGMGTSVGTDNPALFTYLMAIPLLVSRDPAALSAFAALLNLAGLVLAYFLVRRYLGTGAAVLASLLYAANPWAAMYSRNIWAPNLMPPFVVVFFWSLAAVAIDRRPRWLAVALVALAVLLQLHPAAAAYALLVPVALVVWRVRLHWRPLALGLAGALALFAPYIYYEVSHRFVNARQLLKVGGGASVVDLTALDHAFYLATSSIYTEMSGSSYGQWVASIPDLNWLDRAQIVVLLAALLHALGRILQSWRGEQQEKRKQAAFYLLLLLWFAAPVLLFTRHSRPVYRHYLTLLHPVQFILVGALLAALWERGRALLDLYPSSFPLGEGTHPFSQRESSETDSLLMPVARQVAKPSPLPPRRERVRVRVAGTGHADDTLTPTLSLCEGEGEGSRPSPVVQQAKLSASELWERVRVPIWHALGLALLSAILLFSATVAGSHVYLFTRFFAFISGTVDTFYGVPLQQHQRVVAQAQQLAPQGRVFLLSPGDTPFFDDYPTMYAALRPPDMDLTFLDGRRGLAFPAASAAPALYIVAPGAERAVDLLEKVAGEVPETAIRLPGTARAFRFFRSAGPAPGSAGAGLLRSLASPGQLANGVAVLGYQVADRVRAGDTLTLTVYWSVAERPGGDYAFFNHLVDDQGAALASLDGLSYPVANWRAGDVVASWYDLPVPADALPGRYWLQTGLYERPSLQRVPVLNAAGEPTGGAIRLLPIKVLPPVDRDLPAPRYPLGARLGDALELVGYDAAAEALPAGQASALRLFWRARQPMPVDYTVSLQLVDAAGKLAGQIDRQPRGGRYPTSIWDVGEVVDDDYELKLPDAAGSYRLQVCVYDLATLARLKVAPMAGLTMVDDCVVLTTLSPNRRRISQ